MNVETFKKGEVAVLQNLESPFAFANDQECEVVDELQPHAIVDITGTTAVEFSYVIQFCGMRCAVFSCNLKKKAAAPNTVVEWKDCAWYPRAVGA